GASPEWDDARARVEAYFRALRVSPSRRDDIVEQLIQRAVAVHAADPTQPPTTLVMKEAMKAHPAISGMELPVTPDWHPARMVPLPVEIDPLAAEPWEKLDEILLVKLSITLGTILGMLLALFHFTG